MLMGLPVSIEGYGYIYNKALFEQAGIDRGTRTFGELEGLCMLLQSGHYTVQLRLRNVVGHGEPPVQRALRHAG